jgi:prepilin-type N-terminal cleavage/methylation domain-containing protein
VKTIKLFGRTKLRNQSTQRGFTLIEIMAVVLLLGLAMSGVSSNLNRFVPQAQSESAARTVIGDLDLVRSSAISNGRPYQIEFDLDNNQYRIITPFTADGRIARTAEDRTDLGIDTLPKGTSISGLMVSGSPNRITSGLHRVTFHHSGIMNDLVIYLSNDMGEMYDLTVVMGAITGKTLVVEGSFEPQKVTDADF